MKAIIALPAWQHSYLFTHHTFYRKIFFIFVLVLSGVSSSHCLSGVYDVWPILELFLSSFQAKSYILSGFFPKLKSQNIVLHSVGSPIGYRVLNALLVQSSILCNWKQLHATLIFGSQYIWLTKPESGPFQSALYKLHEQACLELNTSG